MSLDQKIAIVLIVLGVLMPLGLLIDHRVTSQRDVCPCGHAKSDHDTGWNDCIRDHYGRGEDR